MLPEHEYHPLVVAGVIDETVDTRSFVLDVPAALQATFAYTAGQFCTFRATIDGAEIVRCYSMSSAPETGEPLTVTVKRVPGGRMSNWMHDALATGDTIDVLRPAGLFVLRETDTPIVAFAGGSGITPIMSIIKSALTATSRSILLVDANRDASCVIFASELERLCASSAGRLTIHHHLDDATGFLDAVQCADLAREVAHGDWYLCGPAPYMNVVEAGLASLDVAPDRVFVERFVPPEPAATEQPLSSPTESVVLRIDRRKHTCSYQQGDTVLETARRAGLHPPFSCEAGNCATCMAHLDAGEVVMRANNVLSAAELEEGWILTCQAVPTSHEVVVDYDA